MEFLEWWNLIFLLPLGFSILYLALLAFSGVSSDTDADLDADFDAGADSGEIEGDASILGKVLSIIGIGKMPLGLVIIAAGLLWGMTGLIALPIFTRFFQFPEMAAWPAMAAAGIIAVSGTRLCGSILGRILPSFESGYVPDRKLIGEYAEVRFTVTERSGSAIIMDENGTLREVVCRVYPGEPAILAGKTVFLALYDSAEKVFMVVDDSSGISQKHIDDAEERDEE